MAYRTGPGLSDVFVAHSVPSATVEEVFDSIIADWRLEYFEALDQKKVWKAGWISVRYAYSFLVAMGLSRVFSFFKVFTRAGK